MLKGKHRLTCLLHLWFGRYRDCLCTCTALIHPKKAEFVLFTVQGTSETSYFRFVTMLLQKRDKATVLAWGWQDGQSPYLGTKFVNQACLDLTFLPQPLPAISWKIKWLSLPPQKKKNGLTWHVPWKMGGPGDYKAESLAFVPRNQLGQITRLLLSTCKITRRWLTGNMHLSRKIMSNQPNFLQ